jgi:hypothetical protein
MKNHYIPKFYLKRWMTGDHLVEFARRQPGSRIVTPKRRTPAATGYQEGLYDFTALPLAKRHRLETLYFKMLDTRAADALLLMENQNKPLTVELRQAWVTFLLSLIMRHPEDIAAFKAVYIRDFNRASSADRAAYETIRGAHDPATVEEFFATIKHTFLQDMALTSVPNLINHERAVCSLMNMHWSVAVPPSHGYFLTSDRPTIRTFLGYDESHWLVPIGPQRLFVAATKRDYGARIGNVVAAHGWKEVNRQVVRQAVSLAYADDERYLPFIRKHLSAATRPSLFWSFVHHPETAPPLERVP